ncbi:MAG: hypothetical protein M1828_007289 [Chrysothrix sp. TS-e1954]|nr:MAG: hypothetical protein M1828_007289 [Chrysothrix sp. TS-e1954]
MQAFRFWKGDQLFKSFSLYVRKASLQPTLKGSSKAIHYLNTSAPSCRSLRRTPFFNVQYQRYLLRLFHQSLRRRAQPTPPTPNPTPHLGSPQGSPSLGERMRKLSREYGWSAFGVYMALSALDFPFCFLAVRMLGTERIGRLEHTVVNAFWTAVRYPFHNAEETQGQTTPPKGNSGGFPEDPQLQEWSWGVDEAQKEANKSDATIGTQLALAYAVHKSFIFIRVPLTAAVTPRVVKVLRSWGWNIGKRRPKDKIAAKAAKDSNRTKS